MLEVWFSLAELQPTTPESRVLWEVDFGSFFATKSSQVGPDTAKAALLSEKATARRVVSWLAGTPALEGRASPDALCG